MKKQMKSSTKKLAIGAASALALILLTSGGAWAYTKPYSYVSLDVNPSIVYTLNRFEKVIDVKAINDDGQVILDKINIDGLHNDSIEDAIIKTVEQISQEGYFGENAGTVTGSSIIVENPDTTTGSSIIIENPDNSALPTTDSIASIEGGIVITITNGNEALSEELVKDIRTAVEDFVEDNVEVEVERVGYDRVQKARELGVTPGKLNLVEKLQASAKDPESINVEEWLNKPVKEIMKQIKENRKTNTVEDSLSETLETSETVQTTQSTETVETTNTTQTTQTSANEATETTTSLANEAEAKTAKEQNKAEEKAKKAEEKAIKEQAKAIKEQAKAAEKAKEQQAKAEEKVKKAEEKAIKEQAKAVEKAKEEQAKAAEKVKKAEEKAEEEQAKAEEKAKKAEEKAKKEQAKAEEKLNDAQEKANNQSSDQTKGKKNK